MAGRDRTGEVCPQPWPQLEAEHAESGAGTSQLTGLQPWPQLRVDRAERGAGTSQATGLGPEHGWEWILPGGAAASQAHSHGHG